MTECDCPGPNTRTANGDCRVMAENRVTRVAQERHRLVREEVGETMWRRFWERDKNGMPDSRAVEVVSAARQRHRILPADVDAICAANGLEAPSEANRRAREERERDTDGQGMEWRLQRLGVPTKALIDLRRCYETPATDAAKKALAVPAEMCPFLALMGETGQGKTVAAAWFFREAARRTSPDVPTGTSPPLVWTAGGRFTGLSVFDDRDKQFLRECEKARLLVIDELGHDATPIGATAIRDLCLQRESNGRRTVLTSNLDAKDFEAKYGKALLDRLMNRGVCVYFKGKSMRLRESMRGGGK